MKGQGKDKRWEEGECTCIVDRNHDRSLVVLNHFRNFKGIYSIVVATSKMEEYLCRERKLLFEIEKRKVKN